jgi:hypothetical protein
MKIVFACALIVAAASVYYLGYMRGNAGTELNNTGSNSSTYYPSPQRNSETDTVQASDPRELAAAK